MADTGYAPGNSTNSAVGAGGAVPAAKAKTGEPVYWTLTQCRKAYLDYLANKRDEIIEQKDARRYYHCSQWTAAQIKALNKRNQPVVTFNRIGRKIDGVVGLIERLRQQPKAYARTPQHEQGAELATAALRYVLDEQRWKEKSPGVARDCAVEGFGGVAVELGQGDHGDPEITFEIVEPDSFFYDPRSFREDFSDARYMGLGKWMDIEAAIELFPDSEDELRMTGEGLANSDLTSNPDRENKWFFESGNRKLIRVVDIWYKMRGEWCYTLFTGQAILTQGESYLKDEKGHTSPKYLMFSASIDHDGDRYGFVRNMKSAQDEYNARRSKALHITNSRRLFITQGAVLDIEKTRQEYARPDGVIVVPTNNVSEGVKADDQSTDLAGQLKMMENAISELENYGPNQALIGDMQHQSGRAIQLLQQAGMAELGPYIIAYRSWKVRVYRAVWNLVQRYWTAERWVRVTDDVGLAQYIKINGVAVDPQTGQPTMVNAVGSLDVDIILDEGADTINEQADVYETLSQVLPSIAAMLSPPEASAALKILIDSSALPAAAKKTFSDASKQAQQPNPMAQQAQQLDLAEKAAQVDETKSQTVLNLAKAHASQIPDQQAPPHQPQQFELPPQVQMAQAAAEINDRNAAADHKRATADKARMDTALAPHAMRLDALNAAADRQQDAEQARMAAQATRQSA